MQPMHPEFAVVEDDAFCRDAWIATCTDAVVHAFPTPEAFWQAVERDLGLFARLRCIVTDYHFDGSLGDDGLAFAAKVKKRGSIPVILASDASLDRDQVLGVIDASVEKMPKTWKELAAILNRR